MSIAWKWCFTTWTQRNSLSGWMLSHKWEATAMNETEDERERQKVNANEWVKRIFASNETVVQNLDKHFDVIQSIWTMEVLDLDPRVMLWSVVVATAVRWDCVLFLLLLLRRFMFVIKKESPQNMCLVLRISLKIKMRLLFNPCITFSSQFIFRLWLQLILDQYYSELCSFKDERNFDLAYLSATISAQSIIASKAILLNCNNGWICGLLRTQSHPSHISGAIFNFNNQQNPHEKHNLTFSTSLWKFVFFLFFVFSHFDCHQTHMNRTLNPSQASAKEREREIEIKGETQEQINDEWMKWNQHNKQKSVRFFHYSFVCSFSIEQVQ